VRVDVLAAGLGASSVSFAALGVWASVRVVSPFLPGPARADVEVPGPVRSPRVRASTRRGAVRRRAAAVDAAVPQLLDLLAAGSSAGLSAELALRRAAGGVGGPLGDDLSSVFADADLGARWREELAAYVGASGSKDLRRTIAVLERTESLGASLVDATRDLAATVRQARRVAILERARTAPVKMLFPLVFLILPAFLLLTVVPVLLTTLRSIS
jgi:tight adherence protein C